MKLTPEEKKVMKFHFLMHTLDCCYVVAAAVLAFLIMLKP